MTTGAIADAEGSLRESFTALRDAAGPPASPDGLIAVLRVAAVFEREAQRITVETVAAMQRDGVFTKHGQRPHTALCALLGIEAVEARRIVTAAEQACPRIDCGPPVHRDPASSAGSRRFGAGGSSARA